MQHRGSGQAGGRRAEAACGDHHDVIDSHEPVPAARSSDGTEGALLGFGGAGGAPAAGADEDEAGGPARHVDVSCDRRRSDDDEATMATSWTNVPRWREDGPCRRCPAPPERVDRTAVLLVLKQALPLDGRRRCHGVWCRG